MQNNKTRHILKVAVLCIAVSLLSFFAGAKVGDPLNRSNNTSVLPGGRRFSDECDRLKPIADVINLIENKYVKDVEYEKLIEGAIKGLVSSLEDPYSNFMNGPEFQDFINAIDGSFGGVGMVLSVDEDSGDIIVVSPIEETPAQKAGILPRDIIVKVNEVNVVGKSLDDTVKLLRGEKGTKVTVYARRQDKEKILKFELIRDDIRVTTVDYNIMDDDIGYIKVTSFDSQTHAEFKSALESLERQDVKGLILDLRNNPGGSLFESVKIANELLGKGLIVYTEDRNKNRLEEYYSDDDKISVPLAVLINENSASASEIVAGAVQDHKAGILIGTKTFGKGSVQEIEPFENGAGMKLTIAQYYIPSGRSIDGIGIKPDIEVKLDVGINPFDVPKEKDLQLLKAIEVVRTSALVTLQER